MVLLLVMAAVGGHLRLSTGRGPVHVAIPPRPAQVTVVYVHGYWTNVDQAWVQHRLSEQFERSGLDAVFVAPEAPSRPGQPVNFPDLEALLAEVERQAAVQLPSAVIAVGHSGAYRTLERWAAAERLRSVVLLDAFYGSPAVWARFVAAERNLYVVARSTAARSEPFCAAHPEVSCESSPYSHMDIVARGAVIPRILGQAMGRLAPQDIADVPAG